MVHVPNNLGQRSSDFYAAVMLQLMFFVVLNIDSVPAISVVASSEGVDVWTMSMLCLKSLPGNIFRCFLLVSFSFLLMKLTVLQLKYFIISEVVCVLDFLSLIFFFVKAAIVIALIVNKGVPPVQLAL